MKKLIFLTLFLSGCGFTPLYGTNSSTYQALKDTQIVISPIPNEYGADMGYILKNQIPTLTQTTKNKYLLSVQSPTFSGYDKTITNDEFASTIQATGTTTYTLTDSKNQKILYKNSVSSISSYNVENSPYATTMAKNKVYKELSEELANQIGREVLAFISKETQ